MHFMAGILKVKKNFDEINALPHTGSEDY